MTRKYRQHGYQESDRPERDRPRTAPRQNLSKEEKIQKRSMRHAIDRGANEVLRCHVCGRNVQDFGAAEADSTCPHCSAPLHCCRNCLHFDTAARWQCRASIERAVGDKSKANECAEYRPRLVLDVTGRRSGGGRAGSSDPKAAFENLFKS